MSKMKEVAALLGVEIGEEFRVTSIDNYCRITDSRFEIMTVWSESEWIEAPASILYELLKGKRKIIKKKNPWKPKKGEEFFVCFEHSVITGIWSDCTADLMTYAAGNVFRSLNEAVEHKEEVLARLKKIYDEGKPLIGADEWRDKV